MPFTSLYLQCKSDIDVTCSVRADNTHNFGISSQFLTSRLHKEWVCKALRAGKNVLVEKPVALSVEEYQEMLKVAYETGKFLMDGTMYPHCNRTHDFLHYVRDENEIGRVDRVETCFSFQGDETFFKNNIRTKKDGDPLGCIGDLGWYCIRMGLLVFPTKPVSARVLDVKLTSDGVPLSASCVVHFENDRELSFQCGFLSLFQQSVEICGSKKSIKMNDYVLPKETPPRFELHSTSMQYTDLSTNHDHVTILSETAPNQEVMMWRKFSMLARSVKPGLDKWTGQENEVAEASEIAQISLANQKVLDALMESIRLGATVMI
jgi:predicted dehydrogenase